MVSTGYMTAKPAGPSSARRFVDQRLLPAAIDTAGYAEAVAERIAQVSRRQPATALAIACGLGFLMSGLTLRTPQKRGLSST